MLNTSRFKLYALSSMLYALRFIPYALYLCFILIYILYALILLSNKKFYLNKGAHPKKSYGT